MDLNLPFSFKIPITNREKNNFRFIPKVINLFDEYEKQNTIAKSSLINKGRFK